MSRSAIVAAAALAVLSGAVLGRLEGQGASGADGEPLRTPAEDAPRGWDGSADLGFTLTEGNSETTSLSLGAELEYQRERQEWRFAGSYVRATTDGEETADKGDAELAYDYFPTSRFFLFAKTSGGFNQPAGLDLRIAPGGGVGYRPLDTERMTLSFQAGGEWTHDEFADGSSDDAARASADESFRWSLTETTDLEQSSTYRPDLSDPSDFLLDTRVSVSTAIAAGLGLKVTFRDELDSQPFVDPETGREREQNDITFVTGVTYRF